MIIANLIKETVLPVILIPRPKPDPEPKVECQPLRNKRRLDVNA